MSFKYILKNLLPHFLVKRMEKSRPAIKKKFSMEFMTCGNSVLNSAFHVRADKKVKGKKFVSIGDDCILNCKLIFESEMGEIKIGNRVFIGNSEVLCREKIEFGNNIFVSWGCVFYDHDSHSIDYRQRQNDITQLLKDLRAEGPLVENKNWDTVASKPIKVCDNAWIGMKSIILKGVTIGEGAIVAAGSVVTKDVAPWTIVGGNPAVFIREISPDLRKITGA